MNYNPEADEISQEDLEAGAAAYDRAVKDPGNKAWTIALKIQAMNPDWTASQNLSHDHLVFLTHKNGAPALINNTWDRARFLGQYSRIGRPTDYSSGPAIEIGVSKDRTVEQAAKAFSTRLLPLVLKRWETHLEGKRKEIERKGTEVARLLYLADALGQEVPAGDRTEFRLHNDHFYGHMRLERDSVEILIRGTPLPLAQEIAKLIKKYSQIGEG